MRQVRQVVDGPASWRRSILQLCRPEPPDLPRHDRQPPMTDAGAGEAPASDVSTAAANGDRSAGRQQDIQNAIDLIRADLAAMMPPASTPAPPLQTPAPAVPQPSGNGKGKGKNASHSNDD